MQLLRSHTTMILSRLDLHRRLHRPHRRPRRGGHARPWIRARLRLYRYFHMFTNLFLTQNIVLFTLYKYFYLIELFQTTPRMSSSVSSSSSSSTTSSTRRWISSSVRFHYTNSLLSISIFRLHTAQIVECVEFVSSIC